MENCPFCLIEPSRILIGDEHCCVIEDAFPVSPGHLLVIPRRHVPSFFETSDAERASLLRMLERGRARLATNRSPSGFNIGVNDGASAGQTVMHLHVHLIPRYDGDCPDPRGGVRRIFPGKADYWSAGGSGR